MVPSLPDLKKKKKKKKIPPLQTQTMQLSFKETYGPICRSLKKLQPSQIQVIQQADDIEIQASNRGFLFHNKLPSFCTQVLGGRVVHGACHSSPVLHTPPLWYRQREVLCSCRPRNTLMESRGKCHSSSVLHAPLLSGVGHETSVPEKQVQREPGKRRSSPVLRAPTQFSCWTRLVSPEKQAQRARLANRPAVTLL